MQPVAEETGLAGSVPMACPGGGGVQRGGVRASRSPRHRVGELSGRGSQRVPAARGLLGVSVGSGCLLPEPL